MLKRLLAETMPDNVALKDLLAKKVVPPVAEREAVAHLMAGPWDKRAAGRCGLLPDDGALSDRTDQRYGSARKYEGFGP